MQMNVSGVRRNLKNLAHNYTDAQVKVREATSNDPWNPSPRLMAEISELTYNALAFPDIMTMIWKRLNDHGKNWRHVYKALALLEYLVKTGSEKVLQQCRENIFAIQTLRDFQYSDERGDQGSVVREKAKSLVSLLNDEEKLKNERAKLLKARERFSQVGSGFGSDGAVETVMLSAPTSPSGRQYGGNNWTGTQERLGRGDVPNKEMESARPQTVGEEELQLQLAIAMSREEAEQEEQRRKSDDVRLQLALSQSQHELKSSSPPPTASHMLDLLDVNLGAGAAAAVGPASPPSSTLDPWGMPRRPQVIDPWNSATSVPVSHPATVGAVAPGGDPWAPIPPARPAVQSPVAAADPWRPIGTTAAAAASNGDPWSPNTDHSPMSPPDILDDFDVITNRDRASANNNLNNNGHRSPDAFDLTGLADNLGGRKRSPHAFLGENSALVNLENLVTATPKQPAAAQSVFGTANPFGAAPPAQNLFQQQIPPRPSLNQLNQLNQGTRGDVLPAPLSPSPNPFLS